MAAQGGSISNALLQTLNPHPYGRYINYLGPEDGMSRTEFETSNLSEYYSLDLSYCHRGKRLNASMLYEIFGGYSGQDSDTVRNLMLNEVTCSESNLDYYERAGFICLQMKNTNMDDWLQHQTKSSVRGDEISVYILCHLFMRHAMIHTRNKAWCSILPTGGNINYAMACDTHLLYMGNNIFGLMLPKPAPMLNPLPSMGVPQSHAALPSPNVRTNALEISTRPTPKPLQNRPLHRPPSAALGAPPSAEPNTSYNMNDNNSVNVTDLKIASVDSQKTTPNDDDSVSVASTVIIHDAPGSVTKVKDADILNKECRVSLTKLSDSVLEKYLSPKPMMSESFDSSDNLPLSQVASQMTNQSEERGRPRRKRKRVKYAESSQESNSGVDSDYNSRPLKTPKIGPGSRPSKDRLRAYRYMKNKSKTSKPKNTLPPVKPCNKLLAADIPSNREQDTKSNNKSKSPGLSAPASTTDDVQMDNPGNKPKGSLSVKHHGLKKFKKIRKFRCKLCNKILNSRREANEHHKANHGKCYCNICGKACNTPSTLERHMYVHSESKPHVCRTCGEAFTFEGEWKQHRFKHRRIAAFPCNHCIKRFMREGELVKHQKVHENKDYNCDQCTYTSKDPRNLKQHLKKHTDDLPYMCIKCNNCFKYWTQKDRHKCPGIPRSSSPEFD